MTILEHKLDSAAWIPATLRGPLITPQLLVVHYTAGQRASSAVEYFKAPTAKASAHLVVDVDGTVTQMVEFNRRAAHAGASQWRGRDACNNFSIGIELTNPGPLRGAPAGGYVDLYGKAWVGDVVQARHKHGCEFTHWAAYPDAQMCALRAIAEELIAAYAIREVVGHDDIAPRRKIDPGPAFPLDRFRGELFGRDEDGAGLFTTTTVLNVRKGPGTHFELAEGAPLNPGVAVELIESAGPWSLIRTPDARVEGWAFSRYLQAD